MAENKTRPVIVYDGECSFCQTQTDRIRRRDTTDLFEFLPRQTPDIEQRYPALAAGDFNTGMRLIHPDGKISVGADAVYQIARRLSPWSWFAWLYRVPGCHFLAKMAYAWVAARRQSLGRTCDDETCPAQDPRPDKQ